MQIPFCADAPNSFEAVSTVFTNLSPVIVSNDQFNLCLVIWPLIFNLPLGRDCCANTRFPTRANFYHKNGWFEINACVPICKNARSFSV